MTISARRTGTTWLSQMFQRNVQYDGKVYVTHEGFRMNTVRMLVGWGEPGLHVNVGYAGTVAFFEAHKRYDDLKYCVLVREPMRHAASLCFGAKEPGVQLERIAFEWGALNTCIGRMEKAGIPYEAWDLSYYVKKAGFQELAAHLDVPLRNDVEMIPPVHQQAPAHRVAVEEWSETMRQIIEELHSGNEYLKRAYDNARR